MARWWSRLRARIKYRRFEQDLAAELETHRAMKETDLVESGLSQPAAHWQAVRELGNTTMAREDARAVWIAPWMEGLWQDLRLAFRRLARNRGFTVAACVTLALGVGASTTAFATLDAVALHPYDWRSPERLVAVHSTRLAWRADPKAARTWNRQGFSWQAWRDLQQSPLLADTAAWFSWAGGVVLGRDRSTVGSLFYVSSNLLPLLGVPIVAGRGFSEDEDRGPCESILISEGTWREQFGARPDIVGAPLVMSFYGSPDPPTTRRVVGVVSARFRLYGRAADVLLPMGERARTTTWPLRLIARMAPGVSISAVQAAAAAVVGGSAAPEPLGARVVPLASDQAGSRATALWLLFGLGILLQVVAASNVASLLLAEAETRRLEVSLRLSLGATFRNLLRQLAAELVLLGTVAVCVGIVIAGWVTSLIVAQAPAGLPELESARVGWRSLLFSCGVGGLALAFAGISPLLSLRLSSASAVTVDGGERTGGSALRRQRALILIQVTLATVMVVVAVLLAENVRRLEGRPLNFDPKGLLVISIESTDQQSELATLGVRAVLERVRAIPGVVSVASVTSAPLSGQGIGVGVGANSDRVEGFGIRVQRQLVSANYFDTMSMKPSQGRVFHDPEHEPNVAVVSEVFAREVLGGRVVGSRITEAEGRTLTVVGSVTDQREESHEEEMRPTYYALGGAGFGLISFVVRTLPDVASPRAVRTAIAAAWPRGAITRVMWMQDVLDQSFADYRFRRSLAVVFGVAAVVLSLLGLYSLMTRRVAQRRRELGIRAALGASPKRLATTVIGETLLVGAGGALLGVVISGWVGQVIRALLVAVSPVEPAIWVFAALGVNLAAIGAVVVPAATAWRSNPAVILRE